MTAGAPSLFLKCNLLFQTRFLILFDGFQASTADSLGKCYKARKRERGNFYFFFPDATWFCVLGYYFLQLELTDIIL